MPDDNQLDNLKEFLDEEFDYIVYFGVIDFAGYRTLSDLLERKQQEGNHTKGCFVLVTTGGLPDPAYRIARALGHHYPDGFRLLVPDVCKSAGTLIAIGANELVISDRGELGPLDVQFQKKEELFEMSSGLDIVQSLSALQEQVKIAFREYLLDIRIGSGLGTKIAATLASEMAANLVAPITSQIDPLRLGEHQRALRIATNYGKRLNKKFGNTTEEQIDRLLTGYPSHSFVIDRKEACELFSRVRAPNEKEREIEKWLRSRTDGLAGLADSLEPFVTCLNDLKDEQQPTPIREVPHDEKDADSTETSREDQPGWQSS